MLFYVRLLRHMRFVPRQLHEEVAERELHFLKFIYDVSNKSHGWRELKHAVCEVLVAMLAPLAVLVFDKYAQNEPWDNALALLYAKVLKLMRPDIAGDAIIARILRFDERVKRLHDWTGAKTGGVQWFKSEILCFGVGSKEPTMAAPPPPPGVTKQ